MGFIEALGQTFSSLPGAALGIGLQGINDRRQYKQQEKLQNLQIQGQKQMMDYGYAKQLQMWQDTSYPAQMELMKKAGINPGLMYGMSGGGGQTTGSPTGNVSGGNAPAGGQEIPQAMGLMLQMKMMESQIDKTKAEAENIKADTANKPKVGANLEASTNNLIAGTENTKAQTRLTNVLTGIQEIEYSIKNDTYEETESLIKATARQANIAADIMANEKEISNETVSTKIQTMRANLMLLQTENELKKANIKLTEEQITKIKADIAQGWMNLSIQQQNAISQRIMADASKENANTNVRQFLQKVNKDAWDAETQRGFLQLQQFLNDIPESEKISMEGVLKILSMGTLGSALSGERTVIQGFKR